MSFYKNVSETRQTSGKADIQDEIVTHARLVKVIRNLSQLIKTADDIFADLEIKCKNVSERTTKLSIKIQHCQGIVDNLNAKAVKVPRCSLFESQSIQPPFKSCRAVSNFSSFPRPSAIERLRLSISSGMVASQVDRTHIYCTALKMKDGRNSGNSNGPMSSSSKTPSSVVAIEQQPMSRMASFRRSLIHVDFLIRRKHKKDKRRNTVAAGDLKDVFPKIMNEDCHFNVPPNNIYSCQQILAKSKNAHNTLSHENQISDKFFVERNNNTATAKSLAKHSCLISEENEAFTNGNSINNLSNSDLNAENVSSKRKPKSHIPISTVSAAMNVAVEMRQCNSVLNGIFNNQKSSDVKQKSSRLSSSSWSNHDESWTNYKKRLQEKYKTLTSNRKVLRDNNASTDVEVSSTASSENSGLQDNLTSPDCDTFFISSEESDDDYSDAACFQEKYGSSTSLHTASDGSLNSLLSEDGTEMTSSTGTLTSLEQDCHLASPPPPPPMILSATLIDKDLIDKVPNTENSVLNGKSNIKLANGVEEKKGKKVKFPASSKPLKTDFLELHRNLTENSKNIFSSLVNLKTHTKDKNKSKCKDVGKKKLSKNHHEPAFDMYGNSSTKEKQIQTFIKENISPAIQNEGKNDMKSFYVKDRPFQISNKEVNKPNSSIVSDKNISCRDENVSVGKKVQVVSNIPPKYEHQVTVKPIRRCKETENSIMPRTENHVYGSMPRESSQNQLHAPRILRPNPPVTQERSKAARVVLDYNGKVIYSTNSLDRKHYTSGRNVDVYDNIQNATCDTHLANMEFYHYSCHETRRQQISQVFPVTSYSSYLTYSQEKAPVPSYRNRHEYKNESLAASESYHLEQQTYCPPAEWRSRKSEDMGIYVSKRTDTCRPCLSKSITDPNISGLPVHESMLNRHNVALHSKRMEEANMNTSENYNRLANTICLSPSQDTGGSILNKSPQSTMSTEDLFAVIHNCKKRLNIKTDPDITSSRSSSPSYIRQSSPKSNLAETGFLSPRSQLQLETSGERKSWADFRPVDSICNERRCLASDRLGPTKPTSMHDFKMLLLQARSCSQTSGPRKSAVEMLKVSPNQNSKNNTVPLDVSPMSPPPELSIHYGHSTVPFKRGNRVRASLQPRYIMYPPIFEEDSENIMSNKSSARNIQVE